MPLFRRRARHESTGHAGDDQLLAALARQSDLASPRRWAHYLYFADDRTAREVAEVIAAAGWRTRVLERDASDSECGVLAERDDAVTSPDAVRRARAFFEALAAQHRGGEYDGWEAGP